MTRRPLFTDPTARTATTNALTFSPQAQTSIETLITLVATLDLSEAEVRRRTGKSRRGLLAEYRKQMANARHTASTVLAEIAELADGLPPDLKAAVREAERDMLSPCEQCGRPAVPPPGRTGGQPQRFCSNACRQKAHRRRTRDQITD
ncbi:hypothetical protein [Kitasatospora sp. NPDC056531]|uniref:hypothetical protein n=1 Tax=Kitasatospora sp. NPDC056531 TaxID=3345856 RepID=UPI00367B328B